MNGVNHFLLLERTLSLSAVQPRVRDLLLHLPADRPRRHRLLHQPARPPLHDAQPRGRQGHFAQTKIRSQKTFSLTPRFGS